PGSRSGRGTATSWWRSTARGSRGRATRPWTGSSRGLASSSSAAPRCSCPSARVTVMTDPAFLALLQLADGLFPAGGFVHSFGLETYVQEGRVVDAAGLEAFV